jgi:hypothetical protein
VTAISRSGPETSCQRHKIAFRGAARGGHVAPLPPGRGGYAELPAFVIFPGECDPPTNAPKG